MPQPSAEVAPGPGQPVSQISQAAPVTPGREKHRVLVVAQTPPPFHGQAISTQRLLDGSYDRLELIPVRLAFSRGMEEVNRFALHKLSHLSGAIVRTIYRRFRHSARVLYYIPSGTKRISMYRDVVFLLAVRKFFDRIIFHFRSAGLSDLHARLNRVERLLFRAAYDRPDLSIELCADNPPDAAVVRSKARAIVPNGIQDVAASFIRRDQTKRTFDILYVGSITRSKGLMHLLEAFRSIAELHPHVTLTVVGEFRDPAFRDAVSSFLQSEGLRDRVTFTGPLYDDAKWSRFAEADALCFPTYFENESFGTVTIEAMQFGLPVVATRWRANPSVVEDHRSGFLVDARDSSSLAEKLDWLVRDPERARRMGERGRALFEERYTVERFRSRMEHAIVSVLEPEEA